MAKVDRLHSASPLQNYETRMVERTTERKLVSDGPYAPSPLPIEILETIFILGASDYHHEDRGYIISTVPTWVNVSYVCRRWRNIALNCPTLWSLLFLTLRRWTKELLVRSRQVPLKLCLYLEGCDQASVELDFVDQVMDNAARIEEFHLHCRYLCHHNVLFSRLFTSAARLQSLKMSAEGSCSSLSSAVALFPGQTSTLRTAELSCCPVPWRLLNLSTLTTLSLHCVPSEDQQSMQDLLEMLSGQQALIHLYLDRALASALDFLSNTKPHSRQTIDVPHLSRLLIDAPLSTAIAFLSCVNFPLKTEVRLHCHEERERSQDDYTSLCLLLSQRFGVSGPTIRSVVVQSDIKWESVVLTLGASEHDRDLLVSSRYGTNWHWDRDIPLRIIVTTTTSGAALKSSVISAVCRSVRPTNVRRLHLVFPPFEIFFWRGMLGHFRDLRCLKLSRGDMPELAAALSVCPPGGEERQEADRTLVPALAELELHDVLLWSPLERSAAYVVKDDPYSLYDVLSGRPATSRGKLTMSQCRLIKFGRVTELNMVGRWEGGRFYVVQERTR